MDSQANKYCGFLHQCGGSTLGPVRLLGSKMLCCSGCDHELFFLYVQCAQVDVHFMWLDST